MERRYHLFFEQSGTFKKQFKKLGYKARDYDIENSYGETNVQIDLFEQIELAYEHKKSIFDKIRKTDMIIAFYPCTKFSDQAVLCSTCKNAGMKGWSDMKKLQYSMQWHEELHNFYQTLNKFVIVCKEREIPLVIENPRGSMHYLNRYWCIQPKLIDKDRSLMGDWYKKPTQYWFIGCEPKNNQPKLKHKNYELKALNDVKDSKTRSLISPEYAYNFIVKYIL